MPATFAMLAAPAAAHRFFGPPPTDPLGYLTAWTFDGLALYLVLAAGAIYIELVRMTNRDHPQHHWPRRRTAMAFLGLGSILVALLSPIDTFSDDLLSVHMIQQFVLTMIAAPLLVASGPFLLLLRAADPAFRRRWLLPILHSRFVSVITFPIVTWVVFTLTLWASHFSALFDLALVDDGVHALEHLLYLAAATLFWWPILGPEPKRWRMSPAAKLVYVLTQMPQMSFLSVVIMQAPRLLYPSYTGRPELFGVAALDDQVAGGGIMWLLGDLAFLVMAGLLFLGWMQEQERADARAEARAVAPRAGGRDGSPRPALTAGDIAGVRTNGPRRP
jgi:putative copper resistance protein D